MSQRRPFLLIQQTVNLCKNQNDRHLLAAAYLNMGDAAFQMGDTGKNIENYRETLQVSNCIGYKEIICSTHGKIAVYT